MFQLARKFKQYRATMRLIEDWERRYPNRCMICSFWDYSRTLGQLHGPLPPHWCVEKRNGR